MSSEIKAVEAKVKWFGAWCKKAVQDVYAFAYTEIGTVLKVAKDPVGKFSGKRVIALALATDVLLGGIPAGHWQMGFAVVKLLVAAGLYILAELTKT